MATKLQSMEISPAKNGGFSVSHRFPPKTEIARGRTGGGMAMITPKTDEYSFGPDQHEELMAHVAKHLGLSQAREEQAEVSGKLARSAGMRPARQEENEMEGAE